MSYPHKHVPAAPNANASYTGYDAAVYAAATSYLQSKTTNQTQDWMKSRETSYRPGNSSTSSSSHYPRGTSSDQQVYCNVCQIYCSSREAMNQHIEGFKHKKAMENQLRKGNYKAPVAAAGPDTVLAVKHKYNCEVCKTGCDDPSKFNDHLMSKEHQNQSKKLPPGQTPRSTAAAKQSLPKVVGVPQTAFVSGQKLMSTTDGLMAEVKVGSVKPVHMYGTAKLPAGFKANQRSDPPVADNDPIGEEYITYEGRGKYGKQQEFFCKLCDCPLGDRVARDAHVRGKRHRIMYKSKVDPSLEVDLKRTGPPPMFRGMKSGDEAIRLEVAKLKQHERTTRHLTGGNSLTSPTPLGKFTFQVPPVYQQAQPRPMGAVMGNSRQTVIGYKRMALPGTGPSDQYVMSKHNLIYPSDEELHTVQQLVLNIERALEQVSDTLLQPALDAAAKEKEKVSDSTTTTTSAEDVAATKPKRLLQGVQRVGNICKGLHLKGDKSIQLLAMCSEWPTRTLLKQVHELLPAALQKMTSEESKPEPVVEGDSTDTDKKEEDKDKQPVMTPALYSVTVSVPDACLFVSTVNEPVYTATLMFTSTVLRTAEGEAAVAPSQDCLNEQACLRALAELRHAKWFQVRCAPLASCLVVLRVLRDVCQRIPTWATLTQWPLELLVEKVLCSAGEPLTQGAALQRVFEAVAGGILMHNPNSPGVVDPCERQTVDATAYLLKQQREDITASAQHALRLIAFNQLYKILALPRSIIQKSLAEQAIPVEKEQKTE